MTPVEIFVAAQVAAFRERAALLARYGAREGAESLTAAATELEEAFRHWWLEELSVTEAAREAGFSEERVRDLVREGRIERRSNDKDGKGGQIRVRRCDLPRKAVPAESPLRQVAARLGIK